MSPDLAPWHQALWSNLQNRLQDDRLPHAFILSGAKGTGKQNFVRAFARSILCKNKNSENDACGHCNACQQFAAGNHPDMAWVTFEINEKTKKLSTEIRIDQIRLLCTQLSKTSLYAGYKIAVITPADRMNRHTANGLLKTLEEPANKTLIFLVTDKPSRLPITIRSRCQQLEITKPDRATGVKWLQQQGIATALAEELLELANLAPLEALNLFDTDAVALSDATFKEFMGLYNNQLDPIHIAATWDKTDGQFRLRLMITWVEQLIRYSFTQSSIGVMPAKKLQALQAIANELAAVDLYAFKERLNTTLYHLDTTANFQLIIEDVLIFWSNIKKEHVAASAQ
ncbi:MAG: DNA polymerase III subunit delta' [Gammaproteobacteria bacterium]|nr:DNA polymerase III subunit delta' [Gammaproteobacteria bacterium]